MPLDIPPLAKLFVPSRPAIIRASDLPRSYAEAKRIKHNAQFLPGMGAAAGFFAPRGGFPTIVSSNSSVHAAGTPWVVSLPGSIVAGNLLLVAISAVENGPSATPAGWTQLLGLTGSSQITLFVYYKVAAGGEGATLNITNGGSRTSSAVSWQFSGVTGNPEVASTVHATTSTPDPNPLTPTWGSKNTLWLALVGYWATVTISSFPTNYTNSLSSYQSAGLPNMTAGAFRQLVTATEDPGSFTLSSTVSSHKTATIGIQGT
jgi:hypothetical protein